jgi:hypothetical protein
LDLQPAAPGDTSINQRKKMTIEQILKRIRPIKRMTRPTLYFHMKKLKIKPLGVRQVPQIYPDDVPERVLKRLGHNWVDFDYSKRRGSW